jgi:hypothetical protein
MTAETWFTAKEALEHGFCDVVLDDEPEEEAAQSAVVNPILGKFKHTPAALRDRASSPRARLDSVRKRHDQLVARTSPSPTKRAGQPAK